MYITILVLLLLAVVGIGWAIIKNFSTLIELLGNIISLLLKLFRQKRDDIVVNKYLTYVTGIAFCIIASLLLTTAVGFILPVIRFNGAEVWYKVPALALTEFAFFGLLFAFAYRGRIAKVELARHGVIFFLGAPIPGRFVLGMGYNWIPPFTSIIQVDVSEQIVDIPETAEENGFLVETLGVDLNTKGTGGKAGVITRLGLRLKVTNSRRFLINDENSDGAKVRKLVRIKATSSVRQAGAQLDNETFMSTKDAIANGMLNVVNPSMSVLGVTVHEISISKATDSNPAVSAARERLAIENSDRAAEITENNHILALIETTARSLMKGGAMTAGEAKRQAIELVKLQTGHATEINVRGDAGDFTKGAAITAASQQPQPRRPRRKG